MGHVVWLGLNLIVVVCLLLADICVVINPAKVALPALMGLGFEYLVWINLLFAFSWLFSHRKSWCSISFLALVLSASGLLSTYSHHSEANGDDYAHRLKIVTYNTHQTQQLRKAKQNDVLRYLKESGADILFLQEYEVRSNPNYLTFAEAKNYLKKEYPYTYFDFAIHNMKRQYGLAIYSKYPLINKETIRYASRANISDHCDVIVHGDTIRLFNNHLESNRFTHQDWEDQDSAAVRLVQKMEKAYQYRAAEVKEVSSSIRQSPYPVIVAGDLNDVPLSYTYHNMSRGLRDCGLYGSWLKKGHTFIRGHYLHAGIRIDYIFCSPMFHVLRTVTDTGAQSFGVPYSDHYPVVTEIAW